MSTGRADDGPGVPPPSRVDPHRWTRLQELFDRATTLTPEQRPAWVAEVCAGDPSLADELLAMLEADDNDGVLDRDLADAAADVLADAVPPDVHQRQFGPYRLDRRLGEGGMGVVHLATRDDVGGVAALKILKDGWLSSSRRGRFLREQRILAQLRHPAVAQLLDVGTLADGTPWLAMEYVDGAPITDYVETHACAIPEILMLFRRVCQAVQHAHGLLVVHRDLKPSNILVTADGEIKLLDFGIAKQIDPVDEARDGTQTVLRALTPAYAAPEQIRGERIGVHTDVYALGVVLYQLITGRLPVSVAGMTPADAERQVTDADPPPPSSVHGGRRPGGPSWSDLDVLCLTALQKDPGRRYATVEALIRDIDHALRHEPLEARRDTLAYRTAKFVRRHRRALTTAALVCVALAAVIVQAAVRVASARDAALAEAQRTRRIQTFMLTLLDGQEKDAGPSEDLRVVSLLDRGALQTQLLDREPLVQSDLHETLGRMYHRLGRLDDAERHLRTALRQRQDLGPSQAADVIDAQVSLGLLRGDQAKMDEAEQLVRDAVATARTRLPQDARRLASATSALGVVLQQRGRYADAIAQLDEARRLQDAGDTEPADRAATLFELASTHFYAGQFDASEALNEQALALQQQVHGERHPLVAETLVNLGAIQFERGRYADAERRYRDALAIVQDWYGQDSYRTGSVLTMLGRAVSGQGRFDDAESLLRRALAIQERVFGPQHPRVASALNDLGNIAMRRGQPDLAEPHFVRIGAIYRATYGEAHYLVGIAVSNLAGVHLARNDAVTAERLYREAVQRFTAAQSATHLNTGIARIKLGRALLRQQRYEEARHELVGGRDIVSSQTEPGVSWLVNARADLEEVAAALGGLTVTRRPISAAPSASPP